MPPEMPNQTTETTLILQFAALVEESRRGNAFLHSVRNKRGLNLSFDKVTNRTTNLSDFPFVLQCEPRPRAEH
jgi:hypothetical protein